MKENQKGFSGLETLFILVVIILIGAIGWRIWHAKSAKKATSNTNSSVMAYNKCFKQYQDANLCHYYVGALNPTALYSSQSTTVSNYNDGTTITQIMIVDSKGNAEVSGLGLNTMTVNGVSYIQKSGEIWTKLPQDQSDSALITDDSFTLGISTNKAAFKALGTAPCGSVTCYKYQKTYVPTNSNDAVEYFWFDTKSYKIMEYDTVSSTASTKVTIRYQDIPTITAPPITKLLN